MKTTINIHEKIIKLLIASGNVSEEKVEQARKLAESLVWDEEAAQQSEQAKDVCPECNTPGGYHKTGCSLWQWEPRKR